MTPSFEQSMLPHLDAAYNLARWLLRNEHDARDCVQEAYLRAFKAYDRFRGDDGRAWLLTIVRNVCYTHLRRVQRHQPPEEFDELQHTPVNDTLEEATRLRRETRHGERLNSALAALPVDMREVIVLHELEGSPTRRSRRSPAFPLGTVMSRLARARLAFAARAQAIHSDPEDKS